MTTFAAWARDTLGRFLARRVFREGLWVGVGQAVTTVAAFVGIKLLTVLLGADEYGRLVLLLGLVALLSSVFCVPLLQATLRFFPDADQENRLAALRRLAGRRVTAAAGTAAGLLVIGGLIWNALAGRHLPFHAFVLAAAYLALDTWRNFEGNLLNAARRQREGAMRHGADAVVKVAAAVLFAMGTARVAAAVLMGYVVASALVSLVLRRSTVRASSPEAPADADWTSRTSRAFVSYALPLTPMGALGWVMSLGDRYLLAALAGAGVVGVYGAAYAIASSPFITASGWVHLTLRAVLYDAVSRGDRARERRVLWVWLAITIGLAVAGTLAFAWLAPLVTRLLLAPEFGDAAALMPWIGAAYGLQGIQHTFEIMMYARGQSRRLLFLQVIAAATSVCAYALLIPPFGAMGAAWATLASFVVTCVSAGIMARAPRILSGRPLDPPADR